MDWNHEVTQANGIDIHYVREGDGFPVLLVHGWPEYWRVWRKNIPALAESFDVIVPDLRGFGESEKPDVSAEAGYGVENHVADLTAFVEDLGIEEFGFVSHDLGAYVGQAIARERPELLRGLFFFDCPYPGIGDRWRDAGHIDEIWYQTFHQQSWAADLVGASRETCRLYLEHFLTHWSGDPDAFDESDIEAWVDTYLEDGNLQGGFNWYRAANEGRKRLMREGAPSMGKIEVPTRLLWGESDPIIDVDWTDRLDEYFANYQLETIDAGHFVHYERPDAANEAIESFFTDLQ